MAEIEARVAGHVKPRLSESRFLRCRFERMKIDDACFGAGQAMSEYVECSFDRSRIVATAPGRARFVRCSFRDVRLKGWICMEAEFVDCAFSGKAEKMVFHGRAATGSGDRSTNESAATTSAGWSSERQLPKAAST